MAKLAKFADLVKGYPNMSLEHVKALVGGRVDADYITNACAIRVSRALNYSELKIPFIKDVDGNQQTLKGADGYWYIFRVKALNIFLKKTLGSPSVVAKASASGGVKTDPLLGLQGIIGMDVSGWTDATGHYTLWDGRGCIDGTNYLAQANSAMLWTAS